MESIEASTQSFVIKVWLEETAVKGTRARWRGHITHVPSGERRYVEDFGQIRDFMAPYLESMGVRLGMFSRFRRKLPYRREV